MDKKFKTRMIKKYISHGTRQPLQVHKHKLSDLAKYNTHFIFWI